MQEMYKGFINSPETTITNSISSSDTIIYVLDPTRVPMDLPNLMTLGTGTNAETIKVLSMEGNSLTVERGFQGTPIIWNTGTIIARNFTEYDYEALRKNLLEVERIKENLLKAARAKTTVVDADSIPIMDSAAENATKRLTFINLKSSLKKYFDTIYNKTKIVNNLTSTIEGSALDAVQGKVLSDGITAVNDSLSEVTDRGYLTTKHITTGSADNIINNGFYAAEGDKVTNLPISTNWHYMTVQKLAENYYLQVANSIQNGKEYLRYCSGGQWSSWQEIATMDKVLPLTGGTVNNLTINRTSNPNLYIKHADADKMGYTTILFLLDNGSSSLRNTIQDGTYASLILSKSNSRDSALMLGRSADPAYKIYGEHNITVSQTVPSTTLPNGCMHNVY